MKPAWLQNSALETMPPKSRPSSATRRAIRVAHVVRALSLGGIRTYIEQIADKTTGRVINIIIPIFAERNRPLLPIDGVQTLPLNFSACELGERTRIRDALVTAFRENGVDVVHSHHFYTDVYALPAARRAHVRRTVRTVHGMMQGSAADGYRKRTVRHDWSEAEIAEQRALEDFCDLTICVSTEIQNKLARYGFPITKTKVIHNGCDAGRFMPASPVESKQARSELGLSTGDLVIGFLGRFEPVKNALALTEIASALRNHAPQPVKFVVQGTGPQEGALREQITSRHLTNEFVVRPPTEDVHRFFAAIDIMFVPSFLEGFPYVVLEAMSSEIPVVAAAVGGIPELIRDGTEGFLFDPTNWTSAVEKLCQIFSRGVREDLGRRSRQRVIADFDAGEKVAAIEESYHA